MSTEAQLHGDYWDRVARESGAFAAVIDKSDRRGIKNRYIDMVHRMVLASAIPRGLGESLDFGCGAGRLTGFLLERSDRVTGVDVTSGFLQAARQNFDPVRCRFLLAGQGPLAIEPATIDCVLSVWTLQYFLDDELFSKTVAELGDKMRVGRRLYLIEQVQLQPSAWQRREADYIRLIAGTGFRFLQAKAVREGRRAVHIAMKYGLIPTSMLPRIARREIARAAANKPRPWVPYRDVLFEFEKI